MLDRGQPDMDTGEHNTDHQLREMWVTCPFWEGWISQAWSLLVISAYILQTIRPWFPFTTAPWGQWFSFSGIWFSKHLPHLPLPLILLLHAQWGYSSLWAELPEATETRQKRPSQTERKACGQGSHLELTAKFKPACSLLVVVGIAYIL